MKNCLSRTLYLRGWTDGDLASRSGIPRSRINRIKNGRVVPKVSEALLLADALDCTVAELFAVGEARPYGPS